MRMTRHLLLPPFTRAYSNYYDLTFRKSETDHLSPLHPYQFQFDRFNGRKAHTYKRPQDCLITSPTSALASASHERNHTSISEQPILFPKGPDINSLPRFFKGRSESTRHHRNRGALRKQRPYLRMNRFQGVQKKTLFECSHNLYNINSIPFRYPREKKLLPLDDTSILGSTDPHSTTVHSSRIELKYLLLPPRSALMEAPAGLQRNHHDPPTRYGQALAIAQASNGRV
uniref:Uncharacterized protein n=1 Tax=Heterorhabditis bacteriophora TaxID=37862 RepID=A0A1I7WDN6_HETBA